MNAVVREITKLFTMRDRSVVRSSVIASAKYSCSGSLDRFWKGNTTIDKRGAAFADAPAVGAAACGTVECDPTMGHVNQTPKATASIAVTLDAMTAHGGILFFGPASRS